MGAERSAGVRRRRGSSASNGLLRVLTAAVLLGTLGCSRSEELPEHRVKAAFLFNFAALTEWPPSVGGTIDLCLYGPDPFGSEIDSIGGKPIGSRSFQVLRKASLDALKGCELVFVSQGAATQLARVAETVRGLPTLVVAESPGAARRGAAINLVVIDGRVRFEANPDAARANGLSLSSRLLRLAVEVVQ